MGRSLPPFAAVRAFEATARHLSVKAAAEELCLTASALSHQIKALEGFLDTQLFERSGNRIALTLTGAAYAGKLTHLLDSMQDETDAVRENRGVLLYGGSLRGLLFWHGKRSRRGTIRRR